MLERKRISIFSYFPKPLWASTQHIDSYLYCHLKRVHRCSTYMISLNIHDINDWRDALYSVFGLCTRKWDERNWFQERKHWTLSIICVLGPRRNENLPSVQGLFSFSIIATLISHYLDHDFFVVIVALTLTRLKHASTALHYPPSPLSMFVLSLSFWTGPLFLELPSVYHTSLPYTNSHWLACVNLCRTTIPNKSCLF